MVPFFCVSVRNEYTTSRRFQPEKDEDKEHENMPPAKRRTAPGRECQFSEGRVCTGNQSAVVRMFLTKYAPAKREAAHRAASLLAGACGDRTHPGGCSPSAPVLKTGRHTSTHLLPYAVCRACRGFSPGRSFYQKFRIQAAEVPLPDGDAAAVTGFQKQQGVFPGGTQGVPQRRQSDRAVSGAQGL